MEKKQHESWVTVRQEGRKIADAKNEMSTLRNRLTLAETKLVEKDLEIKGLEEQNSALLDTVEKVQRASVVSNSSKPDNGSKFEQAFLHGTFVTRLFRWNRWNVSLKYINTICTGPNKNGKAVSFANDNGIDVDEYPAG